MASNLDLSGTAGDVKWKVVQSRPREFMVLVRKGYESKHDYYKCEYPTIFGLDAVDYAGINQKLSDLIEEIQTK